MLPFLNTNPNHFCAEVEYLLLYGVLAAKPTGDIITHVQVETDRQG